MSNNGVSIGQTFEGYMNKTRRHLFGKTWALQIHSQLTSQIDGASAVFIFALSVML
jgi:hypothetical protein